MTFNNQSLPSCALHYFRLGLFDENPYQNNRHRSTRQTTMTFSPSHLRLTISPSFGLSSPGCQPKPFLSPIFPFFAKCVPFILLRTRRRHFKPKLLYLGDGLRMPQARTIGHDLSAITHYPPLADNARLTHALRRGYRLCMYVRQATANTARAIG